MFITDYSSSAFDAANMRIPVFLYVDDLREYVQERGELMWDMEELPFAVAETNEELGEKIVGFNEDVYVRNVGAFLREQGVLEDGKASERSTDVIQNFCLRR